MSAIFFILSLFSSAFAQDYGEYNGYQEFTDGKNTSRHMGFLFMPSVTYLDIDEKNAVNGSQIASPSRGLVLGDFKLGHTFRRGFYLGAIYALETQDINSASPKSSRESFGASVGFLRQGWSLVASFFIHSQQEIENTTAAYDEYSKGLGYQVDFAYHFQVRPWFHIGPALTYKKFEYKEAENATTGVDADASSQHSVLTPMLSMIFVLHR